jgi:tape measure domain-containing protein
MATDNKIEFKISVKDDGLPGLKQLTKGLDEAGAEAQALSREAGAAVEQLRGVAEQQRAVETLRQLAQQGRELGTRLGTASAEVERLGSALQEAKTAQEQAGGATKESAKLIRELEREYNAAVAAAKRASSAVGENRRAMADASQAARDLGIDTSKLVSEKKRLEAAAAEARKGLDAVAASVERVRQRQVEAAAVLQSFQGDLKKLGLEGAQAPVGLEQAFRKLGIDGVRKAESAVHELQVALAQVRNSPDVLPADKKAAVAAFNEQVARLRAEAGPAAGATRDLANAGNAAGNAMGDAAKKAVAWTGALVGLSQLKSLAVDVLETGSAFENLEVRLSNLLGGSDAAASAMRMIKDLAATTPFEVTALAESFVKLTAFGMEPTEEQMRSLADVVANLGGGTEVLTGVTLALGQAWVKGKLQGEEIMQLAERGVPVWDALATSTGRTVPELQKMSEAGALGRDVIRGLIDELGRMNTGASEQLMRTYAGAVSNAKDALAEFFDMIAQSGALDYLTEKIREVLVEFERMKATGELQAKAQEISEAFVAVAKTAEAVTLTLIDMAPVIEVAVKAWLAFKAVNVATALYSIAAGAAVAAPAMTATAVASQGAATGMTVAAGAATALSVALKRLLAATGLGLLLVAVGEIGLRLLGVGESAKKAGDDVEEGLGRAGAASEQAETAANAAASAQARLAKEAKKAADERANAARQASAEEVQAIEAATITRKTDAAVALQDLETRKLLASQAEEMARLVGDEEAAIRARVAQMEIDIAISKAKIEVQRIEAENTITLTRAKLDEAKVSGELTPAKLAELEGSIRLAEAKLKESEAQSEGIGLLEKNLEKTREAISNGGAYRDVVDGAAGANRRLGDAAQDAGTKVETAGKKGKQVGTEIEQAFRRAGVSMQKDLDAAAVQATSDFELIKASGEANADGVSKAWKKMAEAQIAANGGVASEAIRAEAAMYGLKIEVDDTGNAIVKSMADASNAVEGFAKGVQKAQEEMKRLKELQGFAAAGGNLSGVSTEDLQEAQADLLKEGGALSSPEYAKLRNELMERGAPKTDQEGFTLDKSGNRLAMGGDLTTLTGITNFLKGAGLTDEQAKTLALEFSDSQGNIPYMMNPGQMKYGGEGSTMSQALLKAAERTTFNLGANGAIPIGGTTDPTSSKHVVQVINGGKRSSFNAASAADGAAAAAMLKELLEAKKRT